MQKNEEELKDNIIGSSESDSSFLSATEEDEFFLHKLVYNNEYNQIVKLFCRPSHHWIDQLAKKDNHGNTPLHLACMLGRRKIIQLLLHNNAPVKVKNNEGWSTLAESISYGDRATLTAVLRKLKSQSRERIESRRGKLLKALQQMQDFYMELKWDFASWLPLVSRMLPSDICKIHKAGTSLRLDTTLLDFNDMRWERGDISFIFRGDQPVLESLIVLDNEYKSYQYVNYEDTDLEDEVDVLMSTDILSAQLSTKNVNFTRAQSGWIFREDRKEVLNGTYVCDFFDVNGLQLKQFKRREHLSPQDLQKNRAIVDSLRNSSKNGYDKLKKDSVDVDPAAFVDATIVRRTSLEPPPQTTITWDEYINAETGKCPHIGRTPVYKESTKAIKATVAMSKDFPLSVDTLLDVLEVIGPFKHITKLREFIKIKLPPGFPVKLEIPVLHTVTAKVTFQKFEFRDNISKELFCVPSDFAEDNRRFPDL